MPEPVRIRVQQESSGTALKDNAQQVDQLGAKVDQLKAKLAELRAAEKAYGEKGMAPAASDMRAQQIPYARELRDLQRQQRAEAKEQAAKPKEQDKAKALEEQRQMHADRLRAMELRASGHDGEAEALEKVNAIRARAVQIEHQLSVPRAEALKLATREVEATEKINRTRGGVANKVIQAGLGAAGGSQLSGIVGAGAQFGQAGLGIGAILAAVAQLVSGLHELSMEGALAAQSDITGRNRDSRHLQRMRDAGADSSAFHSEKLNAEEDLADLKDEHKETDIKLNNPNPISLESVWNLFADKEHQLQSGSAVAEAAHNEREQGKARAKAEKADKMGRERFEEVGKKELDAADARLHGERATAKELEHRALRNREYYRLINAHATEQEAQRGADLKLAEKVREENAAFGGLINARSGAGDIARAAGLATGQFGGDSYGQGVLREILGETRGMRNDSQRQHAELLNWRSPRKSF